MELSRWLPRRPSPFSRDMNNFMRSVFDEVAPWPSVEDVRFIPSIDVIESGDGFTIKVELPGLTSDDVSVTVQGDTIFLKGEKREEKEERDKGYFRRERICGAFMRAIRLSSELDPEKVRAQFESGLLEIDVKKSSKSVAREVKITSK